MEDSLKNFEKILQLSSMLSNKGDSAVDLSKALEMLSTLKNIQPKEIGEVAEVGIEKEEKLYDEGEINHYKPEEDTNVDRNAIEKIKLLVPYLSQNHQKVMVIAVKYIEAQMILQNSHQKEDIAKNLILAVHPHMDKNTQQLLKAVMSLF